MPLREARDIVCSATELTKENADRLWLALLSLEDAKEFVCEASRLTWSFPFLRGWDNEDAVLRYGAGALPWIETMLERVGEVPTVPALPYYFAGSSLMAIGGEGVNTVLRTQRQDDEDPDRIGFVVDWLKRHGTPAWAALASEAARGSEPAKRVIEILSAREPARTARALAAARKP